MWQERRKLDFVQKVKQKQNQPHYKRRDLLAVLIFICLISIVELKKSYLNGS
jgi:hypothetical protein